MLANPPLYAAFALYQLSAHSMSGKIDSVGFQMTAIFGLACAVFVSKIKQVVFSVKGMTILTLSNFVWQIHDEHPLDGQHDCSLSNLVKSI